MKYLYISILFLLSLQLKSQNLWMEMPSGNSEIDALSKKALDAAEFERNFDKALENANIWKRKQQRLKTVTL